MQQIDQIMHKNKILMYKYAIVSCFQSWNMLILVKLLSWYEKTNQTYIVCPPFSAIKPALPPIGGVCIKQSVIMK